MSGYSGGSGIVIVSWIPYITGPSSSTANDVALFADASGTIIKDGGPLGSATSVAYPTSGTIALAFDLGAYAAIGLTASASFSPSGSTGMSAGRVHTVDLWNTTGGSLALSWNSTWKLANGALPTSLAAGAYSRVVLFCSGTTESSIIASQFSMSSGGGGTVTSVATGTGLTGGPITGSGTISVAANGVGNTLLAQAPAHTIKGNDTGATANETDLTPAQVLAMLAGIPASFTGITDNGYLRLLPVAYATGGTLGVRFDLGAYAAIGLTVALSFTNSSSGVTPGACQVLDIWNTTGGPLTLAWNSSWKLSNGALPTSLAAGAYTRVTLFCAGTTEDSIIASQSSQTGTGAGPAVASVATYAAMQALTPTGWIDGNIVILTGYYTEGDGGGGLFTWMATDTAADNGGTICKTTAATGRLHRINAGSVGNAKSTTLDVRWFGGIPDGASDRSAAFNAAFQALPAGSSEGTIYAPAGAYVITAGILWNAAAYGGHAVLKGDGPTTILQTNSDNTTFEYNGNAIYSCGVQDIQFQAITTRSNNAKTCYIHNNGGAGGYTNVTNVRFTTQGNALYLSQSGLLNIFGVTGDTTGNHTTLDRCSGTVANCYIRSSGGTAPTLHMLGLMTSINWTGGGIAGVGPVSSAGAAGMSATVHVDNLTGPVNEWSISNVIFEGNTGSNPPTNVASLIVDGTNSESQVSGWQVTNCYCDSGAIGIFVCGQDTGSIKTICNGLIADIHSIGSVAGVRLDQCEEMTVDGLNMPCIASAATYSAGVYIKSGGSNPTRNIFCTAIMSGFPGVWKGGNGLLNYGVVFDGANCHNCRVDMNPGYNTGPYVLINSASKANGLVVTWPDGSGGLNCSGSITQNV